MRLGASLANVAWLTRSRLAERRFARALSDPRRVQEAWLQARLARHATSAFGREHDFGRIPDARAFSRQVPMMEPTQLEPWVERVRNGESNVLAEGRVTHLVPTSGSTGARKLIPFSRDLQQGFDAAVAAWLVDLARQRPALLWGPAYWSVSPLVDDAASSTEAVPIGFADDAEYIGGAGAWLVRQTLAGPSSLRHERDIETFWHRTVRALLAHRDLRLISVWHPSFVDLLVAAAERHWTAALEELAPSRARELRQIGVEDWPRWWPHLQVVSCWGDQAAAPGFHSLVARLPHVAVQAKGLLATEAVVTIPHSGMYPLAVTSHYFEFLDASGDVRGSHELERGAHYEVVVTNGGGLLRYRLGDVVECTGHLFATPTLRFVGRQARQSDLRGEKLSEPFVAEVLRALWPGAPPAYRALRAWDSGHGAGYELLVSVGDLAEEHEGLAVRLDAALSANPHYVIARRLGQLAPPRVVPVNADRDVQDLVATPGRLGDTKPGVLLGAGGAR